MITIILVDLSDNDSRFTLKLDTVPETKQQLIDLAKENGCDFEKLESKSMTVLQTRNNLELPEAKLPTGYQSLVITVNPLKKLSGGAVDYQEAYDMLPNEKDGYHKVIKALRKIRNWAEENDEADLQTVFAGLLPTTTKDDLFNDYLSDTVAYLEGKVNPVVEEKSVNAVPVDSELKDLVENLEARIVAVEHRVGIINDPEVYVNSLQDHLQTVKKHYKIK